MINGYTIHIIAPITLQLDPKVDDFVWQDERESDFRVIRRFATDLVLTGSDFEALDALRDSDPCATLSIEVRRYGVAVDNFEISIGTGKWNRYSCELSPTNPPDYSLVFDNWERSYDIFNVSDRVTIGEPTREGELSALVTCTGTGEGPTDTCLPDAIGWTLIEHVITEEYDNGVLVDTNNRSVYGREEIDSVVSPGTDWTNVGGTIWARELIIVSSEQNVSELGSGSETIVTIQNIYYAFGFSEGGIIPTIDNGVLLSDILTKMGLIYGFTVRSEMLGINNVEIPALTPYDHKTDYFGLVVFQKTDITKHDAANNAFRGEITLKEILEFLESKKMPWWMDGSVLRIEHVSYASQVNGVDTQIDRNRGLESYEYDQDTDLLEIKYVWHDANGKVFDGSPVTYNCNGSKSDEVKAGRFSTNIVSMVNNPDSFNKDGFAIIATKVSSSPDYDREVLFGAAGGNAYVMNYPMSFTAIADRFYRHNAISNTGTINGDDVTFETVIPRRNLNPLSLPMADYFGYNAEHRVSTWLGWATVVSTTYSARAQAITIETSIQ